MTDDPHCTGRPQPRFPWSCVTALLLAGLLGACAGTPHQARGPAALPPAPPLPVAGARRYRPDPADSYIRVRVYRAGPLAAVGHNHIIASSDFSGTVYVQPRLRDSAFDLTLPLASLAVDPPALREQAGEEFASEISDTDRAGTRKNMLGPRGLDAAQFPVIRLRSAGISGSDSRPQVRLRITLHGVTREYAVPFRLTREPGRLTATGTLRLRQTDFGIEPYSILAGGLRVQDEIDVRFRIAAVAEGNRPTPP